MHISIVNRQMLKKFQIQSKPKSVGRSAKFSPQLFHYLFLSFILSLVFVVFEFSSSTLNTEVLADITKMCVWSMYFV